MAISRAEFDFFFDNMNVHITALQTALGNSIPAPVETRLAAIEAKMKESEPVLLQHAQQLLQLEQARFAMDTRLGMADQWQKTIDAAVNNYVPRNEGQLINTRISVLENSFAEAKAAARTGGEDKGKGGWQMTRPKDIIPNVFDGKEDDWPGWKESVEDYVES